MKKFSMADVQRAWEEATIQNNFIFSKTMEMYPELCKQLIEMILKIKISRIEYPEREKNIEERIDSKGVRLDVYVEDKNFNRSFNLEMQISDIDNIAKRMRYYQGLIDLDKLNHGQHYGDLGESYVIFICPFDRFKKGRHMYTFKNFCAEDKNLSLDDGAFKIFLSTKGTLDDVDEEVKNFLNYVDSGIVEGTFAENLNNAVQSVKISRKARLEYMTLDMYIRDMAELYAKKEVEEVRMEVLEKGREEGRMEGEKNRAEKIALKLIQQGKSYHEVSELTELPLKDIIQLGG